MISNKPILSVYDECTILESFNRIKSIFAFDSGIYSLVTFPRIVLDAIEHIEIKTNNIKQTYLNTFTKLIQFDLSNYIYLNNFILL